MCRLQQGVADCRVPGFSPHAYKLPSHRVNVIGERFVSVPVRTRSTSRSQMAMIAKNCTPPAHGLRRNTSLQMLTGRFRRKECGVQRTTSRGRNAVSTPRRRRRLLISRSACFIRGVPQQALFQLSIWRIKYSPVCCLRGKLSSGKCMSNTSPCVSEATEVKQRPSFDGLLA